jgi:glutathione S-transferase
MGMLPELKVDNKFVLSQSHAIARFLATQFGMFLIHVFPFSVVIKTLIYER